MKLERSSDNCVISFENAVEPNIQPDTEHLFDRTYRGDKARSGSGAGLGLYIVKLLAQKQEAAVKASLENDRLRVELSFKAFQGDKGV